jgi:hypothetical protein
MRKIGPFGSTAVLKLKTAVKTSSHLMPVFGVPSQLTTLQPELTHWIQLIAAPLQVAAETVTKYLPGVGLVVPMTFKQCELQ